MKLAMNKNIEKTSAPTSLKLNNKIIDNHKEIADVFCEFFTNVGPEYARKIPDPIKPYTRYLKQKNGPRGPEVLWIYVYTVIPYYNTHQYNTEAVIARKDRGSRFFPHFTPISA